MQCIRDIAGQLFKSNDDLNYFKNTVSKAVGPDIPILVELVPLLEKLFSKDNYPSQNIELSPTEAEERVIRIFRGFLSCVAFDDRPLVLFVDDLQWSPTAEVSLFAGLISSFRIHERTPLRNTLLIIAYRVNEVPETTLRKLSESLAHVHRKVAPSETRGAIEIQLGPLNVVWHK